MPDINKVLAYTYLTLDNILADTSLALKKALADTYLALKRLWQIQVWHKKKALADTYLALKLSSTNSFTSLKNVPKVKSSN